MIDKLVSTSGESIAETLVAVLIAALALLMLSGTIITASNLITNSQDKLEDYYQANNTLVLESESEGTIDVVLSGNNISESEEMPYYQLTSDDASLLGDTTLIAYSK